MTPPRDTAARPMRCRCGQRVLPGTVDGELTEYCASCRTSTPTPRQVRCRFCNAAGWMGHSIEHTENCTLFEAGQRGAAA